MRLACDDMIELGSGPYSARVAPAAGGRIAALTWREGERTVPLLVEWDGQAFNEHDWPKAGAFPMLPFANRLPREGFVFRGTLVRPEPGPAGFALHGSAHRRAWSVVESTSQRAVMRCTHDGGDAGWPWPWVAEQVVELGQRGMTVTLSIKNEASEPMPLAMGWHPYHPADPDMAGECLEFTARARHELDENGCAGSQIEKPSFTVQPGETAAFSEWIGSARLHFPAKGCIAVSCTGASGLVLHRPVRGNYFCAEPVTLLPGRLGEKTESDGSGVLHAGRVRRFTWTCGFAPASVQVTGM